MTKKRTPTSRTLEKLRRLGYRADVVERWMHATKQRKDVFGFGDVLACGEHILLVQATSTGNMSSRFSKIVNECADAARDWLASGGRIEVWGWRKYAKPIERKYWRVTRREVTLGDLTKGAP